MEVIWMSKTALRIQATIIIFVGQVRCRSWQYRSILVSVKAFIASRRSLYFVLLGLYFKTH